MIDLGSGTRSQRITRAVVAAALAVAAVDAFVELPGVVRAELRSFRVQTTTAVGDRRMAPAFNYDVSRGFVVEAQTLLPSNARYVFATGPNASASMPVTISAAPFVSRYLLMPRRSEPTAAAASWLLCYGCDLQRQPRGLRIVWRESDAPGLLIARLRR